MREVKARRRHKKEAKSPQIKYLHKSNLLLMFRMMCSRFLHWNFSISVLNEVILKCKF